VSSAPRGPGCALLLGAALAAAGCGGSSGAKSDAGVTDGGAEDQPAGEAAGGDTVGDGGASGEAGKEANRAWPGDCDPVAQDCDMLAGKQQECYLSCPDGQYACRIVTVPGSLKPGDPCSGMGSNSCAPGSICLGAEGSAVCRLLCHGNADCAGKTCSTTGPSCGGAGAPIGHVCEL